MIPKKSKQFIIPTAEKLGHTPDAVSAVSRYFWKNVHDNLTHLPALRIEVPNLGTFTFKHWALADKIKKVEATIQKYREGSPIHRDSVSRLALLQGQERRLLVEQERARTIKENREKSEERSYDLRVEKQPCDT